MLNLTLKCYNQKFKKSYDNKVLQVFENINGNTLRII